jgi:hypothetical protein
MSVGAGVGVGIDQSWGQGGQAPAGASGDPSFASVVFLSGFEGSNGGTSVTDESLIANTVTVVGSAVTSTAQKKFGSSSLLQTTIGDGARMPDSANFEFGSAPFTLEGWFYWTDVTVTSRVLMGKSLTTGNQRGWQLAWNGTQISLSVSTTGFVLTTKIAANFAPTISTWYHIAGDFDGTIYRVYADGVMLGSGGTPATVFDATSRVVIGNIDNLALGFIGHIDEVRITKGVARYASDSGYTSPTSAFPRS